MSDQPAARFVCTDDPHHWVSHHVPGLLIRWVIQCSQCDTYDIEEMNRYTLVAALEAQS